MSSPRVRVCRQVLVIQGDQLREMVAITSTVYRSWLLLPDNQWVAVDLKTFPDGEEEGEELLLKESLILKKLEGVPGIPKLYGMTNSSPRALVLAICSGTSLLEFHRRGDIRTCLFAIVYLCILLSRIHERNVAYRGIREENIIVNVTGDVLKVALVDFHEAVTTSEMAIKDEDNVMLQQMTVRIFEEMEEYSDQNILNRRQIFLSRIDSQLSLMDIMLLLHKVLCAQPPLEPWQRNT